MYLRVVESFSKGDHCMLAAPEAMTARHTGSFDCKDDASTRRTTDTSEASTVVTTETGRDNN